MRKYALEISELKYLTMLPKNLPRKMQKKKNYVEKPKLTD